MADTIVVKRIKEELAEVEAALSAMRTNGQEHSLVGSHSFKGVPYKDLLRQKRDLQDLLRAMNGGKSYTLPDFS